MQNGEMERTHLLHDCLRARVQFAQTNNVRCGIVSAACVADDNDDSQQNDASKGSFHTTVARLSHIIHCRSSRIFRRALAPHITKQSRADKQMRAARSLLLKSEKKRWGFFAGWVAAALPPRARLCLLH